MPKYFVTHITKYIYPSAVTDSANQVILYPKTDQFQQIISQKIMTDPNVNIDVSSDYFGNQVGFFTIVQGHNELEIRVDLEVETIKSPRVLQPLSVNQQYEELSRIRWEYPFIDFVQLEQIEAGEEISSLFSELKLQGREVIDVVSELSAYIYENFSYRQGVTTVESTVDEIWNIKAGVCQDFAQLLIAMLRMLHIPARYISGYICPRGSEMRGEGATHAWLEVYIPGIGWKGIDPTNNCWVNDRHIKIANGRNFNDCTPVKGTYKGPSEHVLTVSVVVTGENANDLEMQPVVPVYSNVTPKTAKEQNSYRFFLEMQQQQQ